MTARFIGWVDVGRFPWAVPEEGRGQHEGAGSRAAAPRALPLAPQLPPEKNVDGDGTLSRQGVND